MNLVFDIWNIFIKTDITTKSRDLKLGFMVIKLTCNNIDLTSLENANVHNKISYNEITTELLNVLHNLKSNIYILMF